MRMELGKRQLCHMTHCGVMCTEWTFGNCWLFPRGAQFFEGEDFSEMFDERIRDGCAGSLAGYGKTMLASEMLRWFARVAQRENNPAGCAKSSSSKAAASEDPEAYPLGYVEDLNDARTKLADFFSILLEEIADQLHRLFRRGSGIDEMRREIFEQAHPSLVGTQQNHGLLCLQRQRNF